MKQGKHADKYGTVYYYKDDLLHSETDLPAVEYADGTKRWYQNGKIHRDNDLPAVERSDGEKCWYQNGLLHRDNDLPAMICASGTKSWHQNGNQHRLAGPAIKYVDGTEVYCIEDRYLTPEEHANHPEVKKHRLQQILNRVVKGECGETR
jgi:hypothetical protein